MVRLRVKRRLIFILSTCFLALILLSYISRDDVEENVTTKYSRDFVLQQQPFNAIINPNVSKKLTKQKGLDHGKNKSHLHVFKSVYSDLIYTRRDHTANFKTFHDSITMFIYDPTDDMISSHVKNYGTWEEEFLLDIANVFLKHKDLVFLDLGCNIGVYSLFMAKFGAKVVAVDPVERSLELLERSLHRNNLTDRVSLVLNALSDTRTKISIKVPQHNKGGAHIVSKHEQTDDSVETVNAITLDDLVNNRPIDEKNNNLLNEGDKIFMKIDIEGNEEKVLVGGQAFFQRVNVIGIFMEWMHHRYKTSGHNIVEILVKNGFLPYDSTSMTSFLNPDQYYRWPENVFWMKR